MLDSIIFKIYNSEDEQVNALYYSLKAKSSKFNISHSYKNELPEYFSGIIRSIKIIKTEADTIIISGSLPKFLYGNNFNTLSFNDLQKCLLDLEEELNIPLSEAKLTRLDISSVVNTIYKPKVYYSSLVHSPHKSRHEESDGIYFNSKKERIIIYDKGLKNKIEDGNNYLRYEHRLLNKKQIVGRLSIDRVENLKSEEVFNRLVQFWYNSFDSINKIEKVYDSSSVNTVATLKDFIYSLGVDSLGGIPATIAFARGLSDQKIMDPKIAFKCKGSILNLYTGPTEKTENKLIKELNQAFKDEYDRLLIPYIDRG